VAISGAAGAVGSLVGQIAKIQGEFIIVSTFEARIEVGLTLVRVKRLQSCGVCRFRREGGLADEGARL
jgi:hypothetical protein